MLFFVLAAHSSYSLSCAKSGRHLSIVARSWLVVGLISPQVLPLSLADLAVGRRDLIHIVISRVLARSRVIIPLRLILRAHAGDTFDIIEGRHVLGIVAWPRCIYASLFSPNVLLLGLTDGSRGCLLPRWRVVGCIVARARIRVPLCPVLGAHRGNPLHRLAKRIVVSNVVAGTW